MRILLIHNYYQQKGGEDIYFENLTQLLLSKGHDVKTYIKKSADINTVSHKLTTAFNMFTGHEISQDLHAIIKTFHPDIAHFNNIFPLITPIAYRICKTLNIPIVQTIQSYRLVCPKGFVYRNNKICELCVNRIFALPAIRYNCYHDSKLASLSLSTSLTYYKLAHDFELVDKYICPAQFVKDYYLQHLSLSEDKMKIIPHFTNVEAVKHMKSNSSYFVFVGRLSEEKGILQLLEQFVLLPNIPLIVIGDGPLRDDVQKYKTYSNITILPFISQKKLFKIMSHALATIIPSPWYEVGPLVLMESFANGTPVIVPNSGVFKERVTRNKTGFFFDLRDFTSIQKVIKSIFKKKNQVAVMRNAVQKEYHDKYSGEAYYRSLLPLYLDLTSANKSH